MCRDSHINSRCGAMKCAKRTLPSRVPGRRLFSLRRALSMRLHLFTSIGFAALALGCGGGQTGDLSGRNEDGQKEVGGTNTLGGCEELREELAGLDEMTEHGSGEELLAFAENAFDAPLTWRAPREGASWS